MRRLHWLLPAGIALVLTACNTNQQAAAGTTAAAATVASSAPVPIGTVKEIMKGIVDPSSKEIWESVGTESGPKGLVERSPKTDEDWAKIEADALTLAEVANLLKMPGRHVGTPEQANQKTVPDAPELTPVQIEEKITKDRAAWEKKADALQATSVKARAAAKAHDKDALLNVGEEIDNACESCHLVYWYPDEKKPGAAGAESAAPDKK
jgi:cytochrome c556